MSELNKYIDQLEKITSEIVEAIDSTTYEQLAGFSEYREQLVGLIEKQKDSLTIEFKQRLIKLSCFDEVILSKMDFLKQDASNWLARQGTIKIQKNAYSSSFSADSMFIDRKN
ncbi:hypothetical protein [Paenibacillus sp. FSL R10-2736]|uniref:hypothetical protein n=1 Tax=Paenibacillus sp. FSL R10-2736 TaxID=2954692 RepID=UPI0030FCA951